MAGFAFAFLCCMAAYTYLQVIKNLNTTTKMLMKKVLLFVFGILASFRLFAQMHDNTWILGYPGLSAKYGHSILTFTEGSLLIDSSSFMRDYDFPGNNSAYSANDGQLFSFFNGIYIRNKLFDNMENGTNIDLEIDPFSGYYLSDPGIRQGSIFLPFPGHNDSVIVLYSSIKLLLSPTGGVLDIVSYDISAAILDQSANDGLGTVIERLVPILHDTLLDGKIKVVQHANGRDWWLLAHKWNSNKYYRILIDPKGIHNLGISYINLPIINGAGSCAYSPDGTKYVEYEAIGPGGHGSNLNIFDFDRCNGFLNNQIEIKGISAYGGVSFSPNSRFLYQNRYDTAFQYDLYATDIEASRKVVAVYDGFTDPFPVTFYVMQNAPDGKIYASATNGTQYLHVIQHPDEEGMVCRYQQHGIKLLKYNDFSVPNFPNYRLGPIDGSSCDTLGLDNLPVAWWRYELDTLDPLAVAFHDLSYYEPATWSWDFGDGSPGSTMRHPQHQYDNAGIYEVCLTVSNVNAGNTHCKTLYLGVSGTENPVLQSHISVSPNPFRERLAVALSTNLRSPVFRMYDQMGRLIRDERLAYGVTEVETVSLPAGMYFWVVCAGGETMKSGKVVKTEF